MSRITTNSIARQIAERIEIPQYQRGEGSPMRWERPPLVTDVMLGRIALQDVIAIVPGREISKPDLGLMIDEYIGSFITSDKYPEDHPPAVLRSRMRLTQRDGEFLLPLRAPDKDITVDRQFYIWQGLAVLVWWASNAGNRLTLTQDTLTVRILDVEYGIVKGVPAGQYIKQQSEKHETPDWLDLLTNPAPGMHGSARGRTWNNLLRAAINQKDEAAALALRVLNWRRGRNDLAINAMYRTHTQVAMTEADIRRLCTRVKYEPEPVTFWRKSLVPRMLTIEKFNSMFGGFDSDTFVERDVLTGWCETLLTHFNIRG